jgi:serine/threonine protein kinase
MTLCESSFMKGPFPMQNALIADRYELLEWRGRGAVGQVYRAYDHLMERHVAFKMPISRNEHTLLESIQHSQVPACYDCCQIDEQVQALVMEWIEGETLHEYINGRGPLTLFELNQIVETLCLILYSLETQPRPICYNDLHSRNVMRRACDGRLFLVDFSHVNWSLNGQHPLQTAWLLRQFVECDLHPFLQEGEACTALKHWCQHHYRWGIEGREDGTVLEFFQQWRALLETLGVNFASDLLRMPSC